MRGQVGILDADGGAVTAVPQAESGDPGGPTEQSRGRLAAHRTEIKLEPAELTEGVERADTDGASGRLREERRESPIFVWVWGLY